MTKTDLIRSYLESGDYTKTVIARYFGISLAEVKRIKKAAENPDDWKEYQSQLGEGCYMEHLKKEFNEKSDPSKHPFWDYDLKTDLRYIQGTEASQMNTIRGCLEFGLDIETLSQTIGASIEEVEDMIEEMGLDINAFGNKNTKNTG